MSELQEATKEFLVESHENLEQLDADLVGLEHASERREVLARVFRTLHTIKGSCAFLGFPRLEQVAHAGENLLGKLRDGQVALSSPVSAALLRTADAVRGILANIESTGQDEVALDPDLLPLLGKLATGELPHGEPPRGTVLAAEEVPPRMPTLTPFASGLASPSASLASAARTPEFELAAGLAAAPALEPAAMPETSAVYDASVRVHVDLLDKLMGIAGEIVLARNQILQYAQRHGDPAFQNTCRQLNLITTELQEHVMKTRLQPIGNAWNRFPRLVHDTAAACGKKVRLDMEGSETELDKTLLEAVRDPLTHLVRNAIDHGIETPERRCQAGKPEQGTVRLRAYHEGGQVNVEVSDDGGGIDPERVRHKAVDQGLLTAEQAKRMTPHSLLGLIFLPGFSTAAAVTTLSGRGVGMDVVKTNVEKIGGSVDVQSTPGQGTTVHIRIPLTLAIIKVLVVTTAGDRYAVPQVSIVELVRVEGEKARKAIQRVHGVHVYRYRDRLLPLVALDSVLQVGTSGPADDAVNIVVLQAAEQQFGLVVDRINDTQEIVVKPLWKHLKSLACFAGATVMGDGKVALILDVFGLAQRAGAVGALEGRAGTGESRVAGPARPPRPSVLLVEGRDGGRMAIPLHKVSRLEEFPRSRIECVAGRRVVQYCGQILPLVDVSATRPAAAGSDGAGPVPVVVYRQEKRAVGLVVGRILDVVERDGEAVGEPARPGVTCTAAVQGRVTEILDVDALIAARAED
jgi:two-component system chemotaxis sensor kinase CheA